MEGDTLVMECEWEGIEPWLCEVQNIRCHNCMCLFKPAADAVNVSIIQTASSGLGHKNQADTISMDVEEKMWAECALRTSGGKTIIKYLNIFIKIHVHFASV